MLRSARTIALCSLALATTGCAAPYYWQAIGGQLELLRKREPIDEVIADAAVDPQLKSTLARIEAMRRFSVDELFLPSNDSYTTYVELDRPYVVWNVVATDEFSVDPQRWCFPFAGCVAYRGYFDKAAADRFAAKLAADGLDVQSGGSTAYSTLGYFDDPVLSTMVNGGEQYVASLLFHELAHQQLYVKSDSEFSEAFAMVVEELGTERWLSQHGTPSGSRALSAETAAPCAVRRAHRGPASSTARALRDGRYARGASCRQRASVRHVAARVPSAESDLARQHGIRRVVRSAAQQCHACVGRDLHAVAACVARAARACRAAGVLRRCGGRCEARRRRARATIARLGGRSAACSGR